MNRIFNKYKWVSLMAFAIMYSFVYVARFSVNDHMEAISGDIPMTAGQQDMIATSVFIAYALGSFVNGYIADICGGRKVIVLGAIMSCLLNLIVICQNSWYAVLILWIVNGYFQSMIWIGGVSMLANWWQEGERGKGVALANFFSGMSHTIAYSVPVLLMAVSPYMNWQHLIAIPVCLLIVLVVLFYIFSVEKPEDIGAAPYETIGAVHKAREEELLEIRADRKLPWRYFLSNGKLRWWCAVAFLSSLCRYGLLKWIPLYYDDASRAYLLSDMSANIILPTGMAFGTLIITWIAGTKLFDNKGIMITALAALCGTLIVVFPMINDSVSIFTGIFFTGFCLYGINGILWVHAIDQGCRVYAGTVAGIFNGCAYLGASFEDVIFSRILGIFHSYTAIFVVLEILCIVMIIAGIMVSKKDTRIMPEIRE